MTLAEVVSQTRVCDTGPQVTFFSLFRCGAQRHSAIRTRCRENVLQEGTFPERKAPIRNFATGVEIVEDEAVLA